MAIAEELKAVITVDANSAISNLDRFRGTLGKTESKAQAMIKTVAKWAIGITGATMGVAALRKALDYAFDAAKIAAEAKQVEKALDNLALSSGTTAAKIVAGLKKASAGTISELNLMKAASRASLFNLPMNQLDKLMAIARASATAMGQSVEYMFDSIVTGIARGSPLILDNLGLTLKIGEATAKYAKSIGKTVEELTAEERKQATLNATLEAGGQILERVGDASNELTDAQRVDKYKAAMSDLKKEIGISLLPVYRDLLDTSTGFLENLKETFRTRNAFVNVSKGVGTAEDNLIKVNTELASLRDMIRLPGPVMDESWLAWAKEEIKFLEQLSSGFTKAAAMEQRTLTIRAGNLQFGQESAKKQEQELEKLKAAEEAIAKAYAATAEGQRLAIEKDIAYYESLITQNQHVTEATAILAGLRQEYDALLISQGWVNQATQNMTDNWVAMGDALGKINRPMQVAEESFAAWGAGFGMTAMPQTEDQRQAEIAAQTRDAVLERKKLWDEEAEARRLAENAIFEGEQLEQEAILKTVDVVRQKEEALRSMGQQAESILDSLGTVWSNYYEGQMQGMDKNSEEYKKLARKQAIAEKAMAIFKATVSTAVGIAKALEAGPLGPFLAALTAAAGAAQIAAIASTPLPAMGEGGIVTKPTMALVGEKGPEAVIPLNRAGGMGGGITVIVNGSVMEEEGLARRIGGVIARQRRGY